MKIDEEQFRAIQQNLTDIAALLDILIKKISNTSTPPKAWLTFDKEAEAKKLREQNLEIYDYICEVLKLYFS